MRRIVLLILAILLVLPATTRPATAWAHPASDHINEADATLATERPSLPPTTILAVWTSQGELAFGPLLSVDLTDRLEFGVGPVYKPEEAGQLGIALGFTWKAITFRDGDGREFLSIGPTVGLIQDLTQPGRTSIASAGFAGIEFEFRVPGLRF